MLIRELDKQHLQEEEYTRKGPYHRHGLIVPFHPLNLRHRLSLKLLTPKNLRGAKCLDFGGGDGVLATMMADKGANVTIADRSLTALGFARQADSRLNTLVCKTTLPVKDNVFDCAAMLETLEHVPDYDEMPMLRETFRVLRPKGSFVITVPSDKRPLIDKHYRHYSYNDLKGKVEDAGFVVLRQIGYRYPVVSGVVTPSLPTLLGGGAIFFLDWVARGVGRTEGLVGCSNEVATDWVLLAVKQPGQ